jgi:hypothetical protein
VKWRFSAVAGDVEGSKLCLFSVIMPAKCVSSVSPRFHYRRVAFCFLPLAAILEFPQHISYQNPKRKFCEQTGDLVLKFIHKGIEIEILFWKRTTKEKGRKPKT